MRSRGVGFLHTFGAINPADRKHRQALGRERPQSIAALWFENPALAWRLPDRAEHQEAGLGLTSRINFARIMNRCPEPDCSVWATDCDCCSAFLQARSQAIPRQGLSPCDQGICTAKQGEIAASMHRKPGCICAQLLQTGESFLITPCRSAKSPRSSPGSRLHPGFYVGLRQVTRHCPKPAWQERTHLARDADGNAVVSNPVRKWI